MGLVEKIKEIGKSNLMNYVIKPAFEYVILPAAILIGANKFANAQEKWIDVWPGQNLAKVTKLYQGDPNIRYRLHEGNIIMTDKEGEVTYFAKLTKDQELYGTISFVNLPNIMTNQAGLDIDKEKSTILKGRMEMFDAKIFNVCLTDIDPDNPSNNSDITIYDNCLAENLYVFSGVAQLMCVSYNSKANNCVFNDVNNVAVDTGTTNSNTTITNSLFKHINGVAIRIPQTAVSLSTTTDDGCIFRPLGAPQKNIWNSSMDTISAEHADWGLDDIFSIQQTITDEPGSVTDFEPWAPPFSKVFTPINYGQIGPTSVSDEIWNAYWNIY